MSLFQSPPAPSSSSSSTTAPSATTPSVSAPAGSVSRKVVYDYLTQNKGLPRNTALGLMANIDRESSFQIAPSGGDGGNSFGMFQWNNTYGRAQLMQQRVPDYATNWKGQIDHALGQGQLPEYNQFTSKFLNTQFATPQAAADSWMNGWERPADRIGGSRKHAAFLAGYNF